MGTFDKVLELIAAYAFGSVGVFTALFVASYARTSWFRHVWGRHVMWFSLVILSSFVYFTVRLFAHDFPGYLELRTLLALAWAAVAFQRLAVQWRGTHHPKVRPDDLTFTNGHGPPPVPLPDKSMLED